MKQTERVKKLIKWVKENGYGGYADLRLQKHCW